MNVQWRGTVLIMISAVTFGLMPIFARFAYRSGVGVQELLLIRFILAFLTIGIFLGLTGRISVPSRTHFLSLLALGAIGYFLQSSFYFTSLLYIPVSVASPVLYTYPAFVTTCSLALGWEKATFLIVSSVLLALVGLVLLANPVFDVQAIGLMIALGAAITYSAYILVSTRVLKGVSGDVASFYVIGAASLSFSVSGLLSGNFHLPWSPEAWFWVVAISLVSTSLAITAFFQGLRMIGPSRASILSIAEPVTSIIVASMAFGEFLTVTQWAGCLLILVAAALAAVSKGSEKGISSSSSRK